MSIQYSTLEIYDALYFSFNILLSFVAYKNAVIIIMLELKLIWLNYT